MIVVDPKMVELVVVGLVFHPRARYQGAIVRPDVR